MSTRIIRHAVITALVAGLGGFAAVQGQQKAAPVLTALDYAEIQQLVNKYSFALDFCTNNGYDYADLFAPDGIFYWGVGARKSVGREQLAEAAGGGKNNCQKMKTATAEKPNQVHTTANLIVEVTPDGTVTGKTYLVYPGIGGITGDVTHTGYAGGYQDVYVKTDKGWRFKSRLHVFPPAAPGTIKDFENLPPAPARNGGAGGAGGRAGRQSQ